jgi:mycoredoxin
VREQAGNVGHVQDSTWQAAIDAGWTDTELTETSAVVALNLFTNSFNHLVGTVSSTPWCGYCRRLTRQLDRAGIAYVSVDIEQDATAARYVMEVNGGNRTVPTVVFADGTALTNPSLRDVLRRVQAW